MKTNELSGTDLDWAVARAEEQPHRIVSGLVFIPGGDNWNPSSNWEQGGPIIEREQIAIFLNGDDEWTAEDGWYRASGPTPLIAAMRCYVASKLGDEVEIPEELLTTC
jgi:hypothetical protein